MNINIYFVNSAAKTFEKIGSFLIKDPRRSFSLVAEDALWNNKAMRDYLTSIDVDVDSQTDMELYLEDLCSAAYLGDYLRLSKDLSIIFLQENE